MKIVQVIWLTILPYSCVISSGTIDDLLRLRQALLSNYTRDVRPVYNLSDSISVDTSLFVLSLIDFDEVSGTITLSAGAVLTWYDYQLVWDPSLYGGIQNILLNSTLIWKPPVYLISSATDLEEFGSDSFAARIYSNGTVNVLPGKLLKSSCSVDMTNFPTDSQICTLLLLVWSYLPNEIRLTFSGTEFIMDYYTPNGEWDVTKTMVEQYLGFGIPSNTLAFTMHLSRKSAYFVISMLVPILLLCFLNPFVFLLPASSGERISYTITMFLSMAVYMTIIGDNMPNVSDPMAGISYFLLVAMCYSCLLIILTIFSLRCEAVHTLNDYPGWLVKYSRLFKRKSSSNKVEGTQLSEQNEQMNITEDGKREITKNDVMNCIDKTLFIATMIIIIVATIWYLTSYYKAN